MTISSPLEVAMRAKNNNQIAIGIFQRYVDENLEGKLLWKSIKMDFKNWTKKIWNAINGKTWSIIKKF